ncbi:MAG: TIGR03557 family F420-dependent LLM class oxidoreductase, partial [Candidatus Methylomirabilales bacterium]
SSEEHGPGALVRFAGRAEEAGFGFAFISDHYHPWIRRQGQSPFVWTVLGAAAQATRALRLGTGVTCPSGRLHPAVIAQAAATVAAMLPGRFVLGVGTGEHLNEHILGEAWPPHEVRLERLAEAVEVIRLLWSGGSRSHRGRYYTVQQAKIFTRPETPPPIYIAGSGPAAARTAGRLGDGLITTAPARSLVDAFREAGGAGKPSVGQLTVCWAADEATARKTAHEWWPVAALPGGLVPALATPRLFEEAAATLTEERVARAIVCGPDPAKHLAALQAFEAAGYSHAYVHQVGPDQEGFFEFYRTSVLPKV